MGRPKKLTPEKALQILAAGKVSPKAVLSKMSVKGARRLRGILRRNANAVTRRPPPYRPADAISLPLTDRSVLLCQYQRRKGGGYVVDIRVWYGGDEVLYPSRRGITLSAETARHLVRALGTLVRGKHIDKDY